MISIFLVLLGFVSSALSLGCPPDETIHPCTCIEDDLDVDVTLTCYDDEDLSQGDLQRVLRAFDKQNTLAIELDSLKLGRLPSEFFKDVNVKRLEISHCELESLSGEGGKPLTGLEDTLEELIITSSIGEDDVDFKLDLGHLKQLKDLELSYNSISKLGDDWFRDGPASLEHLVISNNGIDKLGHRAFAGLENLRSFHLDGNRFGPIRRSILPNPANKLVDMELDNNALTSLPEDMFSSMPSLETVSLRTNGLRKIPKETFETVWEQLEILDMRGNSLECDSHLEWMFQVKSLVRLYGKCQTPPEKEGVELHDLLSRKVAL